MSLTAAEQAAFDHLVAEPGPVTWTSPPSPGGWVASTRGLGARTPIRRPCGSSRAGHSPAASCMKSISPPAASRRPGAAGRGHLAGHPGWDVRGGWGAAGPAGGRDYRPVAGVLAPVRRRDVLAGLRPGGGRRPGEVVAVGVHRYTRFRLARAMFSQVISLIRLMRRYFAVESRGFPPRRASSRRSPRFSPWACSSAARRAALLFLEMGNLAGQCLDDRDVAAGLAGRWRFRAGLVTKPFDPAPELGVSVRACLKTRCEPPELDGRGRTDPGAGDQDG